MAFLNKDLQAIMSRGRSAAAIIALLGLASCTSGSDAGEQLRGEWEAVAVQEEGRPLQVNLQEIRFQFRVDGTYEFESTLAYREAGHYMIRNKYLLTTDTLHPGGREKAVELLQLTPDSLSIRMVEQGKERRLTLVKNQ